MMKKLLFAVCLVFTTATQAQTEVSSYQPGVTVEGITYFLPRTVLRITVVAEKSVTTPGELNRYAFHYLRQQDVITEPKTTWTIKSVTAEPYGTPDRTKGYSIKFKSRSIAPLVGMTKDGILLSINADKQETALPAPPATIPAAPVLDSKKFMNQEMLSAGSTSKMAELCAQEIYDIRESRNELIRGEADNMPKDGAQLQLMLDQLDTQANALEQMFVGTTKTSTEVFTFTYDPQKETDKNMLFRFSQIAGAVDTDDLSGSPVYISINPTNPLPTPTANEEASKKKAKMERGVYYNVPAREKISIYDASHEYFTAEVSMGQFGLTEILSDVLFDKNATTKVLFFQENGGIQKLEQ